MDFIHKLLSRESGNVVSVLEARDQIEIPDDSFDTKLDLWIPAATEEFERMTRRAMVPQTWVYESEDAVRAIELPRPPLIEIVSVYSKDQIEDEWEEVDEDDYVVQTNRSPARLTWLDEQPRFIQVTYRAGYEDIGDVPAEYKLSILQLIAFSSENRGDVEAKLPTALKARIAGQAAGTKLGYWT